MKVVVPLGVKSVATDGARIDDADIFEIALGNDPGLALQTLSLVMERFRQFVENVAGPEIVDAVDGIQAKGVDVIFGEPVQGIVDDPAADAVALRPVKVDGLAPGRVMGIGEAGRELGKIVAFRTEVVVDHVHHDGEPLLMAGVDKFLQAVGTAVGRLRRVKAGAVVSPVSISGKFCDRHDFNRGNAEIAKIREAGNDAFKRALGRERAGVEFVDDEIFERYAAPALIRPDETNRDRRCGKDRGHLVAASAKPGQDVRAHRRERKNSLCLRQRWELWPQIPRQIRKWIRESWEWCEVVLQECAPPDSSL